MGDFREGKKINVSLVHVDVRRQTRLIHPLKGSILFLIVLRRLGKRKLVNSKFGRGYQGSKDSPVDHGDCI